MLRYCFAFLLLWQTLQAKAYWQQRVDVTIKVRLDESTHTLHGHEAFAYVNASPDTLSYLIVHLWPNAYSHDKTEFAEEQIRHHKTDFYFAAEKDRGGIDSIQFATDGRNLDWSFLDASADIARIELNTPLYPGDSIVITTPFRLRIPRLFSRLGRSDGSYFISQWYPKPAVYDSSGWHPMHYLDQGEFYSEFGTYDVAITLPSDYIVMATGNITDTEEQRWLDSLAALPPAMSGKIEKPTEVIAASVKTVHFHEEDVHDFAWFADKRWVIRKQVYRGPAALDSVYVYAAFFPRHAEQWKRATEMAAFALDQYGTHIGPYPYKTLKVVEGDLEAGGGMEYPTLALIDASSVSTLSQVITHEVGHNWFYGMLGSNERASPWMDESLNTHYERICEANWRTTNGLKPLPDYDDVSLFYQQSKREDQAIGIPSDSFTVTNYVGDIYIKAPLFLADLAACVGQKALDSALQYYFNEHRFKHPVPDDFIQALEQALGDRFPVRNWWTSVLAFQDKLRLKLKKVTQWGDTLHVLLNNASAIDAPARLEVSGKDGTVISPVWLSARSDTILSIQVPQGFRWRSLTLKSNYDFLLSDNVLRKGWPRWFHKGLQIGPGFGLQRDERYKVFVAPFPGYNVYDGPALGLMLHNLTFPLSRFQFAAGVQAAYNSRHINGVAGLSYSWYFSGQRLRELRLQGDFKTFSSDENGLNIPKPIYARYTKLAPSIELRFRHASPDETSSLLFKQYTIREQPFVFTQDPMDSLFRPSLGSAQYHYFRICYDRQWNQTFHPYGFTVQAEGNDRFLKLGLEVHKRIDYDIKGKSLYLRAFAGRFFDLGSNPADSRYWLNSTFTGANDYLYDGLYLGRSERDGFAARQLSIQEGGAKLPTSLYAAPLGRSDNWLLAANISSDLPLAKLPIRAYLDLQYVPASTSLQAAGSAVSFQGGTEIRLFRDLLRVYVPLLMSNNYNDYLKSIYGKDRFLKSLTFSVQIRGSNWMRAHEYLFTQLVQ
jgi:hypothetical protein